MPDTPELNRNLFRFFLPKPDKRFSRKAVWLALSALFAFGILTVGVHIRAGKVLASSQLPKAATAKGTPGITTFDVPGAGTGMLQGTVVVGIRPEQRRVIHPSSPSRSAEDSRATLL